MWQSDINNPGSWEASLNIFLGSSHGLHSNGALGSIINLACWPFQTLSASSLQESPRLCQTSTSTSDFVFMLFSQMIIIGKTGSFSSFSVTLIGNGWNGSIQVFFFWPFLVDISKWINIYVYLSMWDMYATNSCAIQGGGASWDLVLLYWIWAVRVSVFCGGRVKVTAAQLNIETLLSHTPSLSVSLFLSSLICQSLHFYLFLLHAQLHFSHLDYFIFTWSSYVLMFIYYLSLVLHVSECTGTFPWGHSFWVGQCFRNKSILACVLGTS